MDSKRFIEQAVVTESRIEKVRTNVKQLMAIMNLFVVVGNLLDAKKKEIFYGKNPEQKFDAVEAAFMKHSHEVYSTVFSGQARLDAIEHPRDEMQSLHVDPRLFHGIVGMATESVELVSALSEAIMTGGEVDRVNLGEELGDVDWYKAIILDSQRLSEEYIRGTVIAKLRERYKDKFSAAEAINRDTDAERQVLEAANDTQASHMKVVK